MQPDVVNVTLAPEMYDMYGDMAHTTTVGGGGLAAMMGAFMGIWLVFYLVILAVLIVSQWKVFSKAGKPGWAALVPFYNLYIMIKVAGMSGWWMLAFFVPFLNLIAMIIITHKTSEAFGHGVGFTLGLIFLPLIFWPILAFGSSQYQLTGAKPEMQVREPETQVQQPEAQVQNEKTEEAEVTS